MFRRVVRSPSVAVAAARGLRMSFFDVVTAGQHDLAPLDGVDFQYVGGDQVIPGAHPLPLKRPENNITRPLVSPFMPSPHRVHPYFTAPVPELPHFDCSVPIVYPLKTLKERIIVPVFNTADGTVSHTRELDPFIFGRYPESTLLGLNSIYWQVRCQNYMLKYDYDKREIWRKAKKNWANTGMGMPRVSHRKVAQFQWGGRSKPAKPWNALMPTMDVRTWHSSNRAMLCLKLLQGKLQIVDRLTLPEPTNEAFRELCARMRWAVKHTDGGVLFMDGGSRITPTFEFDRAFFYGSFINGRVKVVRPTILCEEPYDYNKTSSKAKERGPKGQKNPIPINRFNAYDAMEHHLLVITEGAVLQLEEEMFGHKVALLPPHIRAQMAERGMLDSPVLGDMRPPLGPIETEAAARTEEAEAKMYEGYYDNPYSPWADEGRAAYVVDGVDGYVRREVDGKRGSWAMLD